MNYSQHVRGMVEVSFHQQRLFVTSVHECLLWKPVEAEVYLPENVFNFAVCDSANPSNLLSYSVVRNRHFQMKAPVQVQFFLEVPVSLLDSEEVEPE